MFLLSYCVMVLLWLQMKSQLLQNEDIRRGIFRRGIFALISYVLYIQWNLYKADISLRRTVYLGKDGFTVKLLWKNLYKVDSYKADSRKMDTLFVPQMNFLPKNNIYKADTGTKTIFT